MSITEKMKAQTFGVEIEMYNIHRMRAAEITADFFCTHRCEYTHGGYKTWSAWDDKGREWKFSRDSSIRTSCDNEKCELVTPILGYEDIENLQELLRQLRHAGAKSDPEHGCGIHIHVGGEGHTAQSLRNLVNIMAAHEDILINAIRIPTSRSDHYCKTVDPTFLQELNTKKPRNLRALENVWYGSQYYSGFRYEHYNETRYHMLNLHSFFHGHGTVEFRLFQFDDPDAQSKGGLHAGKIKSYIQLALALSQAAKEAKSASPTKVQMDNQKYAMRTWLLRLGFIGDEFSTARKWLTDRLPGDAAFRHGRKQA